MEVDGKLVTGTMIAPAEAGTTVDVRIELG